MAEGKNPAYTELEQSLINFLCQKKEIETLVNGGSRRVRGLTFNAITGLREKGNCFGLERFIRDWFERPSVKQTIQGIIAQTKKN